jgi:predicted GNAT family N-acyltransferase
VNQNGIAAKSPALVREATTGEELERICRFRYSVYVEEMGKPMPGADHERRCLQDDLDGRSTHLFAEREGEIIGTVRIVWGCDGLPPAYIGWYGLERFQVFPESAISFTGRLMVAGKHRHGPLALLLAKEVYRRTLERGVAFDFIHTTHPLIPFFYRLGYRRYRNDFVDPDLGPRTPLVMVLLDLEHLLNCSFPFLSAAKQLSQKSDPVDWFRREFPGEGKA